MVAKRQYRKIQRAEQEAETRLRITEAAVELHGSVGPARTTISGVAERAGVQRATVYRHFRDEERLFEACSSHWNAQNPPPDPGGWRGEDPDERLRQGLAELYDWYDRGSAMLDNVIRDVALVPALRPSMDAFGAYLDAASEVLVRGRPERGGLRRRVRATVGHALGYLTWRSLALEQGLSSTEAVEVMARAVSAAGQR